MLSYHPKSLTWQTALAPKQPHPSIPHSQLQDILFNRLPAEIRYEIYTHVFTVENTSIAPPKSARTRPHPLSLLLTCRQIHHEASLLAFSTYTFPIRHSMQPTYLGLKASTSLLSPPHLSAIKSLSVLSGRSAGTLLSNALLIFPSLSSFTIKTSTQILRASHHVRDHPAPPPPSNPLEDPDLSLQAISTYAPHGLQSVVEIVTQGRAYAWQCGSRWTAHWPQLLSEACYSRIQCDADGLREELYMDSDAVGAVPGVDACSCGCEGVAWTGVELVQEGGRRVEVRLVYCEVRLGSGAAPSGDAVVDDAGIGFEPPDEEYWEALRRRNGNLAALCRGLWKTCVASQ